MHAQFDKFRAKEISDTGKIVRTREFFSITPEDAYEHLTKVAFAFKLKDATKYKETTLDKKAQEIAEEAKEVRDYNAGDITYANDHIQAIYSKIKNYTLGLDSSVVEEPKKVYIAFKIGTKNFVDISVHRNSLKLFLNVKSGELEDPKGLARDLEIDGHIGHHGNGDYEVRITDDSNLDYIKQLIKYSYEKNK